MYFLTNLIHTITLPIRTFYYWIMRVTPGLKKLPSISTPMLMALMTFFFLFVVGIAAVISYWTWKEGGDKNIWDWLIAFPLIFVIPVVVYYLVNFWMVKEESRYPDIDRIWEAGLEECERNGIHITQVPLFLVQGARDHRQATQLMRASQIPLSVTLPAQEDSDVIFYANSDAIFLFINGCSCISRLSSAPTGPSAMPAVATGAPGQDQQLGATIDAEAFARLGKQGSAEAQPANIGGTLTDGALLNPQAPPPMEPAAEGVGGTMLLPEGQSVADLLSSPAASPPTVGVPQISSQDYAERERKLRYVCGLISKARQTLCPINGLITLLPFELVETASPQIQTAAQKDMAILREELMVRCSNTVLLTQLEKEHGFQELIKRVGEERAREFRFGKGCELWNAPEGDRLSAIAAHAVGAFEDWIYMLFQEENSLKHRYNSRLFMLLCRIRGRFAENLRVVLSRGFGFDPRTESQLAYEQFLFGGCYFAATGADPSRQAFVKSVFLKGIQQEGELEWAPEARRRDRQLQFAANLFALLGAASLLAIVAMLIYKFGLPPPAE